jgi:hypothetical protein
MVSERVLGIDLFQFAPDNTGLIGLTEMPQSGSDQDTSKIRPRDEQNPLPQPSGRSASMKRSIVQAIIAPTALRENDVHAVTNKRMRRYTKLTWKLRDSISFRLPDPMLVCNVSRFFYERISMPCPHCRAKRQRSNYRLPHVRTLQYTRRLS